MRVGVRPRSSSPNTRKQPVRTFLRSYRGTHPLERSALSLLRCGEHPRGYPDVASGRCTPARSGSEAERVSARLSEAHVRKTRPPPHGNLLCPARKGGIVRSDIRVPERSEGGCPCRNEDDNRFPRGIHATQLFQAEATVQNKRAQKRRRLPHRRQRLFR